MKKQFLLLLSMTTLVSAPASWATNIGSPQEVNIKIYEFWISPHTNCTALTRVYNNPSAGYQNMVNGPTFGQINVPNGTYHCVAWKMSDILTLVPNFTSTAGHCVHGQTYTRDLFRLGSGSRAPDGTLIGGTTSTSTEDGMWIYLSTAGNDTNSGMEASQPGRLLAPYIVTNDNNATMITDFTNGIEDTGGECSPETVVFSFRN